MKSTDHHIFSSTLVSIIFFMLMISCSSEKNTMVSKAFHNTTSRYNALFLAKEQMREVEEKIRASQIYNYDETLPVYPLVDSTTIAPMIENLDDCIAKASLIIQFHGNSQYVDDAYFLIGKARFYKGEYSFANETLRFVNVTSEDEDLKHEALIFLIRVYLADNRPDLAEEVSDYLKRQEMTEDNLWRFYLAQADYYQKKGDVDNMVINLAEATSISKNKFDVARIHFLLAQVYQQLGFDGGAYQSYKDVIKTSKDYVMTFYANLFMQQVAQMSRETDLQKARKFYTSLLKESKNEEFVGRIYMEMGSFEERNGQYDRAFQNYNMAIANSQNARARALAYMRIGDLLIDKDKDYLQAKLYYDSVMLDLPPNYTTYNRIADLADDLTQHFTYYNIVATKDSLLQYVNLSDEEIERLADRLALQKKEEYENEMLRLKAAEEKAAKGSLLQNIIGRGGPPSGNVNTWYFYNTSASSQGQLEFRRIYGNRRLEDNWRRSQRASFQDVAQVQEPMNQSQADNPDQEADPGFDIQGFKAEFIASIPNTPEKQAEFQEQIKEALFEKGKVLKLEFSENQMAFNAFSELLKRFPGSAFEPEALYYLFLIASEINYDSSEFENLLRSNYPNNMFTIALSNPDAITDMDAISDKLQDVYKTAYLLYKSEQFGESKSLLRGVYLDYPLSEFSDNIRYLELMNIAKSESELVFRESLVSFQRDFPDSELTGMATKLDSLYANKRAQLYSQVSNSYQLGEIAPVYLMVTFTDGMAQQSSNFSENVLRMGLQMYPENMLKEDLITLGGEIPMIVFSGFDSFEQGLQLWQQIQGMEIIKSNAQKSNFYTFVIDNRNLERLYQNLDIEEYVTFFEQIYRQ